jgi:hypothetical protein
MLSTPELVSLAASEVWTSGIRAQRDRVWTQQLASRHRARVAAGLLPAEKGLELMRAAILI